jgi:putative serine protease PepD
VAEKIGPGVVFSAILLFLFMLIILMPAPPRDAPTEIYQNADYLAHLEVRSLVYNPYTGGYSIIESVLSGSVINADGTILTAGHIADKYGFERILKIKVYFKSGQPPEEAELKGFDLRQSRYDIAILKIKKEGFKFSGKTAVLGQSSDLKVGQPVMALGSPLGIRYFLSAGRICKLSDQYDKEIFSKFPYYPNLQFFDLVLRTLAADFLPLRRAYPISISDFNDFIMHSAAVNPGNSGGPLLDEKGRIIGINVLLLGDSLNAFVTPVALAIPAETIKKAIPYLKEGKLPEYEK